MQLPPWNVYEYTCLNPDLSGPRAYYRKVQAEKRIKECEDRLKQLENRPLHGDRLRVSIEDGLKRIVDSKPSGEERQNFIEHWLDRYRDAYQHSLSYPMHKDQLDAILEQILRCYISVEIEAFQDDCAIVMAGVDEDPLKEEVKEIEKSLRARRKELDWNPQKDHEKWMKQSPKRWRNNTVSRKFPKYRMAEYVCAEFVADWRARAPMFREPVTITGTSIASLPEARRKVWESLYEEMGLGDLPKRVQYIERRAAAEPDADDDKVPEFFRTAPVKAG